MANNVTSTYPFDQTGKSTKNRIIKETRSLTFTDDQAFVVPAAAPFFLDGVRVYNPQTNEDYHERQDYVFGHLFIAGSESTGVPLYGSIVFTNRSVAPLIAIDYQTVGGIWGYSDALISAELSKRQLNPQERSWEMIGGLPEAFPPTDHDQSIRDFKGTKEILEALYGVVNALILSNQGVSTKHINDLENPHKTNAKQVGLGKVKNFDIATLESARAGTSNEEYMTPATTKAAIDDSNRVLTDHVHAVGNVHNMTAADIDLGKVPNLGLATEEDAIAGRGNSGLMTPGLTLTLLKNNGEGGRINALSKRLDDHERNRDNPHGVTPKIIGTLTTEEIESRLLNVVAANTTRFSGQSEDEWRASLPSKTDVAYIMDQLGKREVETAKKINAIPVVDGKKATRVRPVRLQGAYQGYSVFDNKGNWTQIGHHVLSSAQFADSTAFFERNNAGYIINRNGLVESVGSTSARPPVKYRAGSPRPDQVPVQIVAFDNVAYVVLDDGNLYSWSTESAGSVLFGGVRSISVSRGDRRHGLAQLTNGSLNVFGDKAIVDVLQPVLTDLRSVVKATINDSFVYAILPNGKVVGWQFLFDGGKVRLLPVRFDEGISESFFTDLASSRDDAVFLKADGGIKGHGLNKAGQINFNSQINQVTNIDATDDAIILIDKQWGIVVTGPNSRDLDPSNKTGK